MSKLYSMTITKDGGRSYDLLEDFGMVCTSFPMTTSYKAKEPTKNIWHDVDGDDIYLPDDIKIEGFDTEIGICYKGNEETTGVAIDNLVKMLTGKSDRISKFSISNDWVKCTKNNCYFVSSSEPEFYRYKGVEIAEFKIKIHIGEPL